VGTYNPEIKDDFAVIAQIMKFLDGNSNAIQQQ
jgi:hypothetical protein